MCEYVGMIIHGAFGSLYDTRATAMKIIENSTPLNCQCLIVDLRGHGSSDIDDYEEPHSVLNAVNDVMEVVQCFGIAPELVIASGGILPNMIALQYLERTLLGSGVPSSVSFETSGINAIIAPKHTLLMHSLGVIRHTSIQSVYKSINFIVGKTLILLDTIDFKSLKTRADLRKALLVAKSSKQSATAATALLEGLTTNFDLLSSEDLVVLGGETESKQLLPPLDVVKAMLMSFIDVNNEDTMRKLGEAIRVRKDIRIHTGTGGDGSTLEHSDVNHADWDNSVRLILKAMQSS